MAPENPGDSRKAALLTESALLRQRLQLSVQELHASAAHLRKVSSLAKTAGFLALSSAPLLGFLFGRKRRSLATLTGKAAFVWQLLRRFMPIVSSLRAVQGAPPAPGQTPPGSTPNAP